MTRTVGELLEQYAKLQASLKKHLQMHKDERGWPHGAYLAKTAYELANAAAIALPMLLKTLAELQTDVLMMERGWKRCKDLLDDNDYQWVKFDDHGQPTFGGKAEYEKELEEVKLEINKEKINAQN